MTKKLLPVAASTLLLLGCASAPVQEMSDARQAISSAEKAGAETRAVDDLEEARRLLETADQRLDSRDYEGARESAVEAKVLATQAREKALQQSP